MEAKSLGNMNKQNTVKKIEQKSQVVRTASSRNIKKKKIQKEDLHFGFMVESLNATSLTSYYRPHKRKIS